MNSINSFQLGDTHVIFYQRFVCFAGIILIIMLLAIGYFLQENYIYSIALVTALIWLIIVYLYSNIFEVEVSDSGFQIRNIIRSIRIDSMKFKEVRRVNFISFLMVIVFDNRKYYFIMKSEDFLKDFIFADKEYERSLNQKIVEKIQVMKRIGDE